EGSELVEADCVATGVELAKLDERDEHDAAQRDADVPAARRLPVGGAGRRVAVLIPSDVLLDVHVGREVRVVESARVVVEARVQAVADGPGVNARLRVLRVDAARLGAVVDAVREVPLGLGRAAAVDGENLSV